MCVAVQVAVMYMYRTRTPRDTFWVPVIRQSFIRVPFHATKSVQIRAIAVEPL